MDQAFGSVCIIEYIYFIGIGFDMINIAFKLMLWYAIVTVLVDLVATNVYYVTTNNTDDSNSNTLKHYLDNPKKYFTSHSSLIFFPGEYQLDVDLVFKNIKNFTMIAIDFCKIHCSCILVVNVTEFEFQNISLVNCGKNHTAFINFRQRNHTSHHVYHYDYHSSILLYQCASVRIINVNISVNAYFSGILAMNVKKRFVIDSTKVQLECLDSHKFDHQTYGITLHYNGKGPEWKVNANVVLYNFDYKLNGSCIHFSRYAIKVLLVQEKYTVLLLLL